jgi:hypothetical protein
MTTNAIVMRKVIMQRSISTMEFATEEEEELYKRLVDDTIRLSEELEPMFMELWYLHKSRKRLYYVWKERQKRADKRRLK